MPFRAIIAAIFALHALLFAAAAAAGEQEDAAAAAKETLDLLAGAQFETLWDKQASQYLKKNVTRDEFLRQMQIGRANIGRLKESALVKAAFTDNDGSQGYKGRSYGATYLNTYSSAKFYEHIVLVKDDDGKFRLAGTQAVMVPREGMPAAGDGKQ